MPQAERQLRRVQVTCDPDNHAVNRVLAGFETTAVWLNGAPAGRIQIDGQLSAVSLVVENGRVTRI
jgi:hypothetical protein